MSVCPECFKPIEQPRTGRRRKWCSDRCRRASYAGACEVCGAPTSGSDGPGKAAKRCNAHADRSRSIRTNLEKARPRFELIEQLWAAGLTHREIAAELGVAKSTVQAKTVRMRQAGWNVPKRRASPTELLAMRGP